MPSCVARRSSTSQQCTVTSCRRLTIVLGHPAPGRDIPPAMCPVRGPDPGGSGATLPPPGRGAPPLRAWLMQTAHRTALPLRRDTAARWRLCASNGPPSGQRPHLSPQPSQLPHCRSPPSEVAKKHRTEVTQLHGIIQKQKAVEQDLRDIIAAKAQEILQAPWSLPFPRRRPFPFSSLALPGAPHLCERASVTFPYGRSKRRPVRKWPP
jgi:hypothetical protein